MVTRGGPNARQEITALARAALTHTTNTGGQPVGDVVRFGSFVAAQRRGCPPRRVRSRGKHGIAACPMPTHRRIGGAGLKPHLAGSTQEIRTTPAGNGSHRPIDLRRLGDTSWIPDYVEVFMPTKLPASNSITFLGSFRRFFLGA